LAQRCSASSTDLSIRRRKGFRSAITCTARAAASYW
jgi:hypothetical protein